MSLALLIDFGSTYTKLRALDLDACAIVATAQGPSTVTSDVNLGLDAALATLATRMGGLPRFRYRLASSSAAGGLRMVTVGLVRELTAEAARQAALGAGARLVGSFAYRLTAADLRSITGLAPDILLLCGGTDGGNADVLLHNARVLGGCGLGCPVIVAGNREASDEAATLLRAGGAPVTVTANVMPALNELDIDPARAAIRDVFMHRIVAAKGIERAGARFDQVLMPTPAAVLEGARLLADGLPQRAGHGPLLVVDPGGATTDVHSIGSGEPSEAGVLRVGLPEPYAKRTVEGDLGMRHNAASIVAAAGIEVIAADAGLGIEAAQQQLARVQADVSALPAQEAEFRFDEALVRAAIGLAVLRHAGTRETVFTANGPVQVQRGKDLSNVGLVIGTGGAIVHARTPSAILDAVRAAPSTAAISLRPRAPRLAVDAHYLLYAAGLLAAIEPVAAFDTATAHLDYLQEGVAA